MAEMRVVETEWEGESAFLASLRDVTERKQVEEALAQSERRYRLLADNATDVIWAADINLDDVTDDVFGTDVDFRLTYLSPSVVQLLGYSPEEATGRSMKEITTPFSFGTVKKVLANALEAQSTGGSCSENRLELEMRHKDGSLVWAETTMDLLRRPEDGRPTGMMGVARDICERKRAEEARLRIEQLLREKVTELETFSYGIAHDLRSPLLSIERFSYELQEDIQNQNMENVQEDIQLLQSGVRKMRLLVDRTLEYSRAGYLVKPTENIPFSKIVEEVIADFAEQLSSIGATVSLADGFPMVFVDRMRMVQLLNNLIQNSIKYRDKTVPLRIEIGYQPSEDEVIFFVRDNGSGIDAGETEKVFDLFYQGTADGEGSGAGLAIVKRIIEAHGGRVWAEQGQAGKGTTICFALPQQNPADN